MDVDRAGLYLWGDDMIFGALKRRGLCAWFVLHSLL